MSAFSSMTHYRWHDRYFRQTGSSLRIAVSRTGQRLRRALPIWCRPEQLQVETQDTLLEPRREQAAEAKGKT